MSFSLGICLVALSFSGAHWRQLRRLKAGKGLNPKSRCFKGGRQEQNSGDLTSALPTAPTLHPLGGSPGIRVNHIPPIPLVVSTAYKVHLHCQS